MIPGLEIVQDAISEEYEQAILNLLPVSFTRTVLGARCSSQQLHYFSPVPEVISMISEDVIPDTFKAKVWSSMECDSAIVQSYAPGDGIAWHIDLLKFTDGVAILSLLSDTVLKFRRDGVIKEYHVPRRSLVLCSGEARYDWEHAIENQRDVRISVTLRRLS